MSKQQLFYHSRPLLPFVRPGHFCKCKIFIFMVLQR